MALAAVGPVFVVAALGLFPPDAVAACLLLEGATAFELLEGGTALELLGAAARLPLPMGAAAEPPEGD